MTATGAEGGGNAGGGTIAVIGDVHGHLQLALCMAARWQRHLGVRFEAVFLCGDVGTFTDPSQLDSATVSHARNNECELEFLHQWSVHPQAPWLGKIFEPSAPQGDGLGLCCPVVMVHGNHEGFAHLQTLFSRSRRPDRPVPVGDLRGVDSREFIRYLPSGWKTALPSGMVVAGIGGMEAGQRRSKYHPLAYVDDGAVEALLTSDKVDVLVTHQGPESVQGDEGSATLQMLLDAGVARAWFHGHGTPQPEPVRAGPGGSCVVVPLGQIAFPGRGRNAGDPGQQGWSHLSIRDGEPVVVKETPPFWREFRRHLWTNADDGRPVCPDLAPYLWKSS